MNGIEYVLVVFGIMLLVIGIVANKWRKKNRR
jgi:hypothetical protein